jgi:HK97 family phage prohead protease
MIVLYGYARLWWELDDSKLCRFGPGGPALREYFAPGAFGWSLTCRYREIRALWNHDRAIELARTADGSLMVWEDHVGLGFYLTPRAGSERFVAEVTTGAARGMSIGGLGVADFDYDRVGAERVRKVTSWGLTEISITPHPACSRTTVTAAESVPVWLLRRQLESAAGRGRMMADGN